ncbi:MAG: sigma-70 family RNA polymerase sigma factor [Phycisphaerae bacterium]|nr:RNA polymerase sigma factor [Phycisphaerae bacterium]NIR62811.1 RNA polymerase sigma factor [candidate division Zixibacteria bacterium]NIP52701.1 RNA polymerase sigma factor [Phycisphaerae bacterium]NIS51748.1 RNA polymerase sigma factor [Phycisphaerae bacterium]NIU56989.1 sigma-70 family RNA polymerase sigma factor [Phycisphaerae bacterium]
MPIDKLQRKTSVDIKLMRAIARGNKSELGQLYLRHKDRAVALAYRILGQWNRAEDISQEAFIRVYMAAGKYKPEAEFTTWLYKIIINLCIDEKRRTQRSDSLAQTYGYLQTSTRKSLGDDERAEIIGIVHKAIRKLNQRQRTVVILHKLEGLSHAEISNRTGWSQSSIESLLVRAYRKLRKELIGIFEL